eukprot:CAMPEP_0198550244 /NCGR_PEP_ID=MMETSP1462-20131121/74360_1 /TAXON_ID=1333877 /ORGANISM="Brandtodinium nutriculum, Strain RCC3387" /LENGTH=74 /DNA_ID=CAMNT_0044280847 /DNA_START=58 /DNA_END=278 /DNA_ORIENTATION=+
MLAWPCVQRRRRGSDKQLRVLRHTAPPRAARQRAARCAALRGPTQRRAIPVARKGTDAACATVVAASRMFRPMR